jgi:hypothetical protein
MRKTSDCSPENRIFFRKHASAFTHYESDAIAAVCFYQRPVRCAAGRIVRAISWQPFGHRATIKDKPVIEHRAPPLRRIGRFGWKVGRPAGMAAAVCPK